MNSFFLLFIFLGTEGEKEGKKTRFYDDSVGELTKITVEPVSFCLFVFFFSLKSDWQCRSFWYFTIFLRSDNHAARGMSERTCLCRRRGASIWKWKHALLHQACEFFVAFPFALPIIFPSCYLSRLGKLFGWDSDVARVNRKRNGASSWLSSPVVVKISN